ncbi:hypothetical protein ACJX0J_029870, partial [Zea mays]
MKGFACEFQAKLPITNDRAVDTLMLPLELAATTIYRVNRTKPMRSYWHGESFVRKNVTHVIPCAMGEGKTQFPEHTN